MKKENDVKKINALKQVKKIMQKCKDRKCFAIVKHVSNSGMSRVIHFVAITKNGDVYCLDPYIHDITGYSYDRNWYGLRIGGCGMDMIFNTLYVVNSYAIHHNIIKKSKKRTAHDIQYNGIINTYYNYF